jgi:hypothetical protein
MLSVGNFSFVHYIWKRALFAVLHKYPHLTFKELYSVAFDEIGVFAIS